MVSSARRGTTYIVVDMFDYAFAENGLTAYKESQKLASASFIGWIGEEEYKKLARFILHYIADLEIPIKRFVIVKTMKLSIVVHSSSFGMA